ncbi:MULTISPECIES: ribosome small subunit-dependent GTPase A [unclassified Frondihabitans]|uniref:ribosome small subunit-dependent GTPase A n=1 Tax=unclassified Frondihabitans TaxID=2626248 RepID=UPI000F4F2BFC|nr:MULTISPECIES: ribosome small subunit-dependent GTPase A [unclassified Frondihabitans]RPE74467.1 ribosome biogenesis GTPase [Frondihabitans sp. PhB153]RPF02896.1 ribosome biogenesis GTPase [Frondihabitans sp. PhB161]
MSWWSDGEEPVDEEYSEYDESSIRIRPNPKANRPRTKQRPAYDQAVPGVVWTVDRGRYGVLMDAGTPDEREITTARARELGKKAVVTGDRVDVVGDTSGAEGSLARIVRVQERTTLLRRSADDTDAVERVIVANADQMLIVVAAADPEPRPRLVDRYLVAAFDAGVEPILVITKTDLADPEPFAAHFSCLDLRILTTSSTQFSGSELDTLRSVLDDHVTVTVGHSGVGKSTLVNALTGSKRAVGVVNTVTGRGRHTSSSTVSFKVPSGGWIVDTPGVRSFGLGHVNPENILRSFASHAVFPEGYEPPGGIPLTEAHDWEIIDRVEAGELGDIGRERLESLQTLLGNRGA